MSPVLPFLLFSLAGAQIISTSTPVPPLQWINLSNLLQGSDSPPPLRDAAIGYDETSGSLIIFGGLSESGFPQSQTYLLNLNSLTWSVPSPPANLQTSPPARSSAVFGIDFAASNRHGFVVMGGRGADGQPLSDVWEYDFINQFWSQVQLSPGGPSPRWGASGGIDIRTPSVQDPVVPGPNNTFYLAGGTDETNINPLSDIWRLNISGTLSSNLPDSVGGSWEHITLASLPGRINQAGTVIAQEIIAFGGCNSTATANATTSCALQDSFVIDAIQQSYISPGACPAPRISPVLVPNMNGFSSTFASQVFLLLGTFNSSMWQDSNGLAQGEVSILDVDTGTWARVLPSGDPSGQAQFPTPREGATAFAFSQSLVGSSQNSSADTIVFGGQDSNGTFLSELWLLRSYPGSVSSSTSAWSGFGNGQLSTGVNADGSGVEVKYLSECASLIALNVTNPGGGANPGGGSSTAPAITRAFNAGFLHKLLAPLSLALTLPIVLFFRRTHIQKGAMLTGHVAIVSIFIVLAFLTYGLAIAGLILSFTTISKTESPKSLHLKTAHGISGLFFAILLYAIVPVVYLVFACLGRRSSSNLDRGQSQKSDTDRPNSVAASEKPGVVPLQIPSNVASLYNASPPSSPRPRTLSWDAFNAVRPSTDGDLSNESTPSPTPHARGFEVLNRHPRTYQMTDAARPSQANSGLVQSPPPTRGLGDIDWLLRRRSLNAVGELDYILTQAHNAQVTSDAMGPGISVLRTASVVQYPDCHIAFLHILTHVSILGLSVVSLSMLWTRAPRYLFILFLLLVTAFYIALLVLAFKRYPRSSLLTMTVSRFCNSHGQPSVEASMHPPVRSPYAHHRPSHRTSTQAELLPSQSRPLSVGTDDIEGDIDEDTHQRMIEEEMERRDVSIVTVPRRKLWVANPS